MENSAKRPQQWEMLASPGHVLLAQVNAYRLKAKLPAKIALGSVFLTIAALIVGPFVGQMTGSAAGWITGKVSHWFVPKAMPTTPAPAARQFLPVLANVQFDPQTIPNLVTDVAPAMLAQVEAMKAGKKNEDCDFTKKITDPWFDGKDTTPKCRYSQDGTRLWVWAYVKKNEYQHGPFAGLIVKAEGKVTYANVDAPNVIHIDGNKNINPNHIPRTVAADFPELLIEAGK